MKKSNLKLKVAPEPAPPLRLDLGCGNNKRDGFKGVDFVKTDAADYVHDLFTFPWPFKDSSVEELHAAHFFEHVPHLLRGKFMDEAYRILVPGGKFTIICPYYTSVRATQDFTHEWPGISQNSFLYFNKGWREQNKLTHGYYDLKADFDFSYGWSVNAAWQARNDEARNFAIQWYANAVDDIHVNLVSRKPEAK